MQRMTVIKRTMLVFGLTAAMLAAPIAGSVVTVNAASSSVKIDAKHFPDESFRDYIVRRIDKDENGSLSKAERAEVKEMNVVNIGVITLQGVEYFPNLTTLDCGSGGFRPNKLKELDVSKNTNLQSLYCNSNQLKKLDVSKNTKLKVLDCSYNELKQLDVSKNTKLEVLECFYNQLKKLDVSKNTKLNSLSCSSNQLKKLDVSKNTKLNSLSCSSNQLKKLDVSKNTKLTCLECKGNPLSTLDVSNCSYLTYLKCNDSVEVIGYRH